MGWTIFMGEKVKARPSASLEEAQWMIEKGGVSQSVYQEYRLRFRDRFVLPPVMKVAAENQKHRPDLVEYSQGVLAPIKQCLSLTLSERLQLLDLSGLDSNFSVKFKFNWGLDGSGEHPNPSQLTKLHFSTKQFMLVCFSIKEITVTDQNGQIVKWSGSDLGANKPQHVRPLSIFPSKEDDSLLKDFIPIVEREIREVNNQGVVVKLEDGSECVTECVKDSLSMIDGKMVVRLLQLGGGYCTMCTINVRDGHNPEVVKSGLSINRNVDSIRDLALSLTDTDTGEIRTRKKDYSTRQGVTGIPITESDITKNIPVCHSKIRTVDWFSDLLTRAVSHKKWYHSERPVTYTGEERSEYLIAQELIKDEFYQKIGVNLGNPGDMVAGNAFKTFSSDSAREVICGIVSDDLKEDVQTIHLGLCAVVKVINSQKRLVNIPALSELCTSVYLTILKAFPWAIISPSVHRILAHSVELVELNGGYGLGDMSEEGSEALNRYVRKADDSGSRADSTFHRFTDIFNHLWDRSRPKIVEMERKIIRRKEKVVICTEIETLVLSLFLEDE